MNTRDSMTTQFTTRNTTAEQERTHILEGKQTFATRPITGIKPLITLQRMSPSSKLKLI